MTTESPKSAPARFSPEHLEALREAARAVRAANRKFKAARKNNAKYVEALCESQLRYLEVLARGAPFDSDPVVLSLMRNIGAAFICGGRVHLIGDNSPFDFKPWPRSIALAVHSLAAEALSQWGELKAAQMAWQGETVALAN